jgi:V8-like Glu-specific endopeptidase
MGSLFSILFGLLILASCSPKMDTNRISRAEFTRPVIYGEDNRQESSTITSSFWAGLASASVAIVSRDDLIPAGDRVRFVHESVGAVAQLCRDEAFYGQPTISFCSGALVGENLVLTAGHCFQESTDCKDSRFLFNYAIPKGDPGLTSLPMTEVFACKKILAHRYDQGGLDYTLIELDRPVAGHRPLTLPNQSSKMQPGGAVTVIGTPSGFPQKIISGGQVRKVTDDSIVASLDTYAGASGAPVFNSADGTLVGILSQGAVDYTMDPVLNCNHTHHCTEDGCNGERIVRIETILPEISSYLK